MANGRVDETSDRVDVTNDRVLARSQSPATWIYQYGSSGDRNRGLVANESIAAPALPNKNPD